MKTAGVTNRGAFILIIAFSCFSGLLFSKETAKREPTKKSRPRINSVKLADFYLRSGKLISGKLVLDDKNKIIVEKLDDGRIVVSTYSKRKVETRTLRIRNIPEFKYYLDLAEYFSGRTWDFKDDPDDFIQAIRCYEKARQLVSETQTQSSEKIEQINQSLERLQADRQVWIREAESRAQLKKLEFEATLETRIKELEDMVNANAQQLDKLVADMKDNHRKLEKSISGIDKDMSRRLEILDDRIEANRVLIDYRRRWYPRY